MKLLVEKEIMLVKKESNVVEKLEYNNEEFNYQVTTTRNNNELKRVDVGIYTQDSRNYVGNMSYGDTRFSANLNALEDNVKHTSVFNEIYAQLVPKEEVTE